MADNPPAYDADESMEELKGILQESRTTETATKL